MKFEWIRPKQIYSKKVSVLAQQVNLPKPITYILYKRGYQTPDTIKKFLNPSLDTFKQDMKLPDKDNLLDIGKTCQIIKDAIKKHWKIQLYDDYDTDGITSATIMYTLIHKYLHYDNISYYLPDRFKDGYGPNLAEYKRMYKQGMQLLITTDNGISGYSQIAWLKKHGVHVIITDHHDWPVDKSGHVIKSKVPDANAICMANCPYHKFHFDDFCGAGIAFMIACKMLGKVPTDMLDLACLGTIADSVNLKQENRILVKYGVEQIRHDKRKGIQALAGEADVDLTKMTSTELSFSLIPRLNAIGRMDNANMAVELLMTDDSSKALEIAQTIEGFNKERQKITQQVAQEAIAQAEKPKNIKRSTLVLWAKDWFPGIVGIVASRIVEKFHKPTLICGHLKSDPDNVYRGSGRSFTGFNLSTAMQPMQRHQKAEDNVMVSFGGHPFACGFTIKKPKLGQLSRGLELASKKQKLDELVPTIQPDLPITASDVTLPTIKAFKCLEPLGVGNEMPTVDICLPQIYNVKAIGKQRNHLSFTLGQSWKSVHVIAFNMGDKASELENSPFNVELAGSLNINHYKGHDYPQLMVKHLHYYAPKPSHTDFGLVYKYLYARAPLTYTSYRNGLLQPLSAYLHIGTDKLNAIFKVFKELKLLSVSQTKLVMLRPKSCHLSDSKTYRQLV